MVLDKIRGSSACRSSFYEAEGQSKGQQSLVEELMEGVRARSSLYLVLECKKAERNVCEKHKWKREGVASLMGELGRTDSVETHAEGLHLIYCVEKKILKANAFKKSLDESSPSNGRNNSSRASLGWVRVPERLSAQDITAPAGPEECAYLLQDEAGILSSSVLVNSV